MSLWVITAYFNPAGFCSKRENFQRFAERMREHNVYVVEAVYPGESRESRDTRFWRLCRSLDLPAVPVRADSGFVHSWRFTSAVLFQKERLLNVALGRLPADCDKVAWLDCDILFENPNWAEDASKLLDKVPIVQLFDSVRTLEPCGREMFTEAGMIARRGRYWADRVPGPHGYAWAARRELLDKHGFYDRAIVGGGSVIMAQSIFGRTWPREEPRLFTQAHLRDILAWSTAFHLDVQGSVSFVPGAIKHLWHGSIPNRRYMERHEILTRHDFDPVSDIAMDAESCWKWHSDKPELHREVAEYFVERDEDRGVRPVKSVVWRQPDALGRIAEGGGGV